ncbi:MAG: hypothetical protein A2275_01690 [Bacteroidetes bacterium RIFOXYA12_FULL_35_11]|nr:MAG: hypothetical protein A2X01_19990 [Bacteroidetes bacterium GWF2_35_48]OFY76827.1 MAG: hypothetical protein A2275_01690 [Bacteroidetes bacterium RIFOXYA12_FULL_35_11]OFZ00113.1 MAG: hypothetical protein A2491_19355 [Bacteroidetes bacterium RIFOXYC12_FULL_35_7]HBX50098.1 hypothetical protein [Bacteroidales bacterium]
MIQKKLLSTVSGLKNIISSGSENHVWQFSRVGGVNRVNLDTGMDLLNLEYLDQKLWTALSCPVHGLEIDAKTLELIDTDHDNRIRVPEIIAAVKWLTSVIKNPDELTKRNDVLPLDFINENTEEGKILLASAKQILKNLGTPDEYFISVSQTSDTVKIFANTKFNGDGIITEDSSDDAEIKKIIQDVITCIGSSLDRSGKAGITTENINDFYQSCEEYSNWISYAETEKEKILPYGNFTAEAYNSFLQIKTKIEDYFLRCRLAEFDSKSAEALNSMTTRFEAISNKDLPNCIEDIAALPIAKIENRKDLPLNSGINPAWENALSNFVKLIVTTELSNKHNLTEEDWKKYSEKFIPYEKWQSEKAGIAVEKLGIENIKTLLSSNTKEQLMSLLEQDKALEKEADNIFLVDKLARYYRDLYSLLNNFVTFHDFYSPNSESIFQSGSLYIDQRSCDLCIKVSDMGKHGSLAGSSGVCLVYCNCFSKIKNEKMTIVAALTDGDIDNIAVGRNAIFYDRKGNDWDATIVKIIDNPISIRQAFWSPYRKISKFLTTQIEKVASSKEKDVEKVTTGEIEKTSLKVDTGITESVKGKPVAPVVASPATAQVPAAPPVPFDIGKFVGIFAALSLALGAIGSVIASLLAGFFSLVWWQMPLAFLGIILSISGPSMILAYLKLRKRNLAPILDANGWAINARATINIPFGNTLTHLASLPKNSKLNLLDPFAKKKKPWIPILIVVVIALGVAAYLLWHYGFLKKWGIM